MFIVRTIRFESGEQMPLLCRTQHNEPVLLPLIYVVLRRRHKSVSTIRGDAMVLKWLYEWFWMSQATDLDQILETGRFDEIFENLEQFAFWLRTARTAHNIVGRIGNTTGKDWLHPQTYNGYLTIIQAFMLWAIERYSIEPTTSSTLRSQIIEIKDKIRYRFESLKLGGKTEVEVKGLELEQIDFLLKSICVGSKSNPFKKKFQLRNWIIVKIFLETGMRRGELLKLKTTDLHEISGKCYLVIKRRPDDPTDARAIQPAQKTLSRTISISEQLYTEIEDYITSERRPIINGKRSSLKHQFLITSERGTPLSQSVVNSMFDLIHTNFFERAGVNFHPHLLRNTFCNNYLEWCVEKMGMELDRSLDELRLICGWGVASKMPLRYAAKWVAQQANEHNQIRIQAARSQLLESAY